MIQKSATRRSRFLLLPAEAYPKTRRFKAVVISGVFILALLMPMLDQCLGLSAGFKNTEKRILTPFPTFRFPHVLTFVAQFNQYYKENFGWRNTLFYQYSQWKYKVLGESPLPEKVVIGKNGWFYLGNYYNRVLDQHRGIRTIQPDTIAAIARHLTKLQQRLATQGATLYVLVAPDSYSLYPEYLPDNVQLTSQPTNFDRFNAYINQHTTIPLVDVRNSLRAAKSYHKVYFKTDTHWNDYGAMVATLTFVSRVRQDFPTIPKPRLADYRVRCTTGVGGDLVTMIALNREFVDSVAYKITPAPFLCTRLIESKENKEIGLPTQRFVSNSAKSPKLLLVGDSYSYSMNQFLPNYFRESYMVRSRRFDWKLAQVEHPDIVVLEIAERDIGRLGQL